MMQYTNARALRSDVHVDETLNSRKKMDEGRLNKLAESIKRQGLINPPLLIRSGQLGKRYEDIAEPYVLVAGFRRQKALDMLAEQGGVLDPTLQESDYRIAPPEWELQDAIMANLGENLQRDDLTPFELASQCVELRDTYKLQAQDIANRVKAFDTEPGDRRPLSAAHINNLMRCIDCLHAEILKAWEECHPKASLRTLIALAAQKDKDAQLQEWLGINGQNDDDNESGESGEGAGEKEKPARRPSATQLSIMIERIKMANKEETKPADWCKGAVEALKWAAGSSPRIPGIKIETAEAEE